MDNVVKYGMSVVGGNLRLVRNGNFDGLREKIKKESERKFGPGAGYLDDQTFETMLRSAAESLERSKFFWWRMGDALRIFEYLGDSERARLLQDRIKSYERNYIEQEDSLRDIII